MTRKTNTRAGAKKTKSTKKQPAGKPLLRGMLDRFKRLFAEELPITEYPASGKFESQVDKTKLYQDALEKICGGRSTKKEKFTTSALVTPDAESGEFRVTIENQPVGLLKRADAKFLQKQLDQAELGPCAVKVAAQIRDGRWKKKGPHEDYTVFLCLPQRPPKPTPAEENLPE
ncbi:MAG TPA: hypothetical protein VFT72_06545 [Opitutaceae bacterium]|nr:hypothetical protein [Opitutaceae bacterium]